MRLVVYIGIENFLAIRLFKFEDLNEEKEKKNKDYFCERIQIIR